MVDLNWVYRAEPETESFISVVVTKHFTTLTVAITVTLHITTPVTNPVAVSVSVTVTYIAVLPGS